MGKRDLLPKANDHQVTLISSLGQQASEVVAWECFTRVGPMGRLSATLCNHQTVWPSGLRRWLQAPVRKGVGSNPTAVIFWESHLACAELQLLGGCRTVRALLARVGSTQGRTIDTKGLRDRKLPSCILS
jgi:hypothetical protein